ncbi:MAG TPA: hypothetical protein VFO46_08075 [Candidatus Sulfotelmatobacter sp.]|nr:hypothetical protein [Candidatus Sulfotelmatobacter sp.]
MKVFQRFRIALLALPALCCIASAQEPFTAGTWTPTTKKPASAVAHALLLNDGSVLVNSFFFTTHNDPWYRLKPDSTGSYIHGTWSNAGTLPSGYNPLYFASALLPSGQVVVIGGEYNNGTAVWTTQGAVYTPSTNTWTAITAPSGWSTVGDAQSVILPSGHMMLANCCTTQEAILTMSGTTASWASTGTGKVDWNDEEGWTLLPGGKVLTVDAYVNTTCCNMGYQLYTPSTGAWTTPSNNTVVNLVDSGSRELGPMVLLPNKTVFAAGATTNNAIYTISTGTWAAAPKFGGTLDVADGPAAVLPDGNALFDASPGIFNAGSKFFEWDGTTMNATTAPPNASADPSYVGNMVVLPTGQVLFTDFSGDVEIYTPVGSPCAGCAPTISTVATTLTHGSNNNSISGTQFNGLTQGAYYGDDNQSASNFPIVRITDAAGHVVYCKTHGWRGGVATGSTLVSAKFDVPSGISLGTASLVVVTNGIPSAPVTVTII